MVGKRRLAAKRRPPPLGSSPVRHFLVMPIPVQFVTCQRSSVGPSSFCWALFCWWPVLALRRLRPLSSRRRLRRLLHPPLPRRLPRHPRLFQHRLPLQRYPSMCLRRPIPQYRRQPLYLRFSHRPVRCAAGESSSVMPPYGRITFAGFGNFKECPEGWASDRFRLRHRNRLSLEKSLFVATTSKLEQWQGGKVLPVDVHPCHLTQSAKSPRFVVRWANHPR